MMRNTAGKRIAFLMLCLLVCCTGSALAEGVLKLPEALKIIEEEAFAGLDSVERVIVPDGVTEIGTRAFAGSGIRRINLPESIERIAEDAFEGCDGLVAKLAGDSRWEAWCEAHSIEVETQLPETPSKYFTYQLLEDKTYEITGYTGPEGIDNLVIPAEYCGKPVTSIGERAFYDRSDLKGRLVIPESIKTIGNLAFYNCSGFTGNLTIPDSVTSIGKTAFGYCSGFTGNLTISDSMTSIGSYAFEYCSGFTGNLTIGNSVTKIERSTFSGCSGFKGKLTIGNSVTAIEKYAFYNCNGFTGDLRIPDSVTAIEEKAFYECSGFTRDLIIGDGVTTIGDYAFSNCSGFKGNLVIGNSVTTIGAYAFESCRNFAGNLTIGNSVETIGDRAFEDCGGFTGDLTIGNSVTTIGEYAFSDCGFTGKLTIGNGLTTIRQGTFYDCRRLTGDLTIPNSVTIIEGWAFRDCSGFTGTLTIPDSVRMIGDVAFEGCSGFVGDLTIPDSVVAIGSGAFRDCSGFTGTLTIPNGLTTIEGYAFEHCSGFTGSLTIPDSVTTIRYGAFWGCSGFTGNLIIPDSVTTIEKNAFRECSGFTGELVLSKNITTIPNDAFYNCSGFTGNLRIPDGVTSIGSYSFGYNSNLLRAYIPDTMESMEPSVFFHHNDNFTIHGMAGSYAETYAAKNRIKFSASAAEFETVSLTGAVFTESFSQLPGVSVSIYRDSALTNLAATVTTDEGGIWTWNNARCGERYYLVFALDGYTFAGNEWNVWVNYSDTKASKVIASAERLAESDAFILSTYQWNTDAQPEMRIITVSSNSGWYLIDAPEWVDAYVQEEQERGVSTVAVRAMTLYDSAQELLLNARENTTGQERTGVVLLSNGVNEAEITITQSAETADQGTIHSLTVSSETVAVNEPVEINLEASIITEGILVIRNSRGEDIEKIPFTSSKYAYRFVPRAADAYTVTAGVSMGMPVDYENGGFEYCSDVASCTFEAAEGVIDYGGMKPSDQYVQFLTDFEKFHDRSYPDGKSKDGHQLYSIGYGHNYDPRYTTFNEPITKEYARELYRADLARFSRDVNSFANEYGVTLNQHQFDALVDFCYNLGSNYLKQGGSSLANALIATPNASEIPPEEIARYYILYHKEEKSNKLGIYRRRYNEAKMFILGDYNRAEPPAPAWLDCTHDGADPIPEGWHPDFIGNSYITTKPTRIDISRLAYSNLFLPVESTETWSATSNAEWISITKASGENGESVRFSTTKNTGEEREGTITLTCGSAIATLTIHQFGEIYDPFLFTAEIAKDRFDAGENVVIDLAASGGAGAYQYQSTLYMLDGSSYVETGKSVSVFSQSMTNALKLGGLPAGYYRADVLGKDLDGNSMIRSLFFSVRQIEMAIINPVSSGSVLSVEAPVNIQWTPIESANEYVIRIRDLTTGKMLLGTDSGDGEHVDAGVTTLSLNGSVLSALKAHALRIWIGAYQGEILVGQAQTIATIGPVKDIEFISPQNNAEVKPGNLTVSWKAFDGGANGVAFYQIRVRDCLTDQIVVDESIRPESSWQNQFEYVMDGSRAILSGRAYRIWVGAFTKEGGRIGQSQLNISCKTDWPIPTVIFQNDYKDPDKDLYYVSGSNGSVKHTIKAAGCGLCAIVNAVNYLTGNEIDVHDVAKYARDNDLYEAGSGTKRALYKDYADAYGSQYQFSFDERVEGLSLAKEKLKKGEVAIVGVKRKDGTGGHIICVAAYDEGTDKYLVLDSAGTKEYNWTKSGDDLWSWQSLKSIDEGYEFEKNSNAYIPNDNGFNFYKKVE